MENRNNHEIDDEQEEVEDSGYGQVPSESSPHTQVDTTQIKPSGTGCRTLFIFILLAAAVIGLLYFYNQSQSRNQPAPENSVPGQTQQ